MPTAIPVSHVPMTVEDVVVLLWVRHGSATVRLGDGTTLSATVDQAVLVPPGVAHAVDLSAGSVALPLLLEPAGTATGASPVVLPISPGWSDWLTHHLSRTLGFGAGAGPAPSPLLALVAAAGREGRRRPGALPSLPPMPRSPGARSAVEALIRDPAGTDDLPTLAGSAHTSERTLQRQLTRETGSTVAGWRRAVRVRAAATHLAEGRPLDWTAHRVGYATASSLTRAFTSVTGRSPASWVAARPGSLADTGIPAPDPGDARLGLEDAPPPVPGCPDWSCVSDVESYLWVHRGRARLTVAGRDHHLDRGDVVRLGRAVAYRLRTEPGCVVLPLGWRDDVPLAGSPTVERIRVPLDQRTELALLHTVVAGHFLLRPPRHDPRAVLDLLFGPPAPGLDPPPHLTRLLAAVLDDPADRRSLDVWSRELAVDAPTLRRDSYAHLGEAFTTWRAQARMSEARSLLWQGVPPTAAARRLGYRHLSAFSRAFAVAHGLPPREWLRREAS